MKDRIAYWDYLRGIAILMVVAIHCYPFEVKVLEGHYFASSIRALINTSVPLFLAVSGFFIGRKQLSTKDVYISFLRKQIPRVYIPCIIFSIPITLLSIYKGSSIIACFIKMAFCQSFVIYYFIALIIQFYILTPLIQRIMLKPLMGGGILVLNLISLYVLQYILTEDFDYKLFLFRVGPFIYWIAYYALGIYLSKSKRDYSLTIPLIIMIIGYSVQFLETYFFGIGIDLPVSIVIYSCGAILILFSTHTEKLFNKFPKYLEWLASIGRYSFVIYLIHLYVLLFFNHFVATNYWSIKWLCASILSYASVWLLDKVVPNKQKKYIGLY